MGDARRLAASPRPLHEADEDERIPSVAEALARGGASTRASRGGRRRKSSRSIVALLPLPAAADRERSW